MSVESITPPVNFVPSVEGGVTEICLSVPGVDIGVSFGDVGTGCGIVFLGFFDMIFLPRVVYLTTFI